MSEDLISLQPDAGKQGTIFCVDVGEYMFEINSNDEKKRTHFEIALKIIREQMNTICISADLRQMIGIIFFNTGKTNKDAKALDNIFVYRNILDYNEKGYIKSLDADSVKQLDILIKDIKERNKFLKETLDGSGECDYGQLIWLVRRIFNHDVKLQKQICNIFTRGQFLQDYDEVKLHKIKLDILEVKMQFSWIHYLLDDEVPEHWLDKIDDEAQSFSSLKDLTTIIKRRNISLRPTTTITMNFGQSISLAVGIFHLILEQKLETGVYLDEKTSKPIQSKSHYIKQPTQESQMIGLADLLINENDKIGPSLLKKQKINEKEIKLIKNIGGKELKMERKELEEMKKIDSPGIYIIGFKPMKYLKKSNLMCPMQYLYPNEDAINGSAIMYKTLWKRCLERNLYIIARMTFKKNTPPRLVGLIPQEGTTELRYEGFHVVQLPFSEYKRNLKEKTEGKWIETTQELNDTTEKFVKKLTTNYDPTDFTNPILQKHYWVLEGLATGNDEFDGNEHDFDLIKPYWKSTQKAKKEAENLAKIAEF